MSHGSERDKSFYQTFLQGWYLLQDAALDANENNMIQTAIQGSFGLQGTGATSAVARRKATSS